MDVVKVESFNNTPMGLSFLFSLFLVAFKYVVSWLTLLVESYNWDNLLFMPLQKIVSEAISLIELSGVFSFV